MNIINKEKLLKLSTQSGLIWIISHFVVVFFFNRYGSFDVVNSHYYNATVYILMMVYVVSLLMFDALLWFIKSQEVNKAIKRYWAIVCVITIIWFLFRQPLMESMSGNDIIILFFVWQISPLAPTIPLSYLFLYQTLGIEWDGVMAWHSIIVLFISTIHFIYFYWLSKRIN